MTETIRTTDRPARLGLPDLGVGVGLRIPHYPAIFGTGIDGLSPGARAEEPTPSGSSDDLGSVDWFEVISENFMVAGGRPIANLHRAMALRPIVQHGVSLSIGGTSPFDKAFLGRLKQLLRTSKSAWVSDHLCWTGVPGKNLHDLLPLPYTDEIVRHVARRAREVQDFLETPLVLENVSSYMTFTSSRMTEWDFVTAVVEEADCGLLLDVNNVYVSSFNHGFDPKTYIENVPHHRVVQMHLAGHTNRGRYILDTHSAPVVDPVWDLYRRACELCGPVSTLVEWDDDIPPFRDLCAEADKARAIRREVERARAA